MPNAGVRHKSQVSHPSALRALHARCRRSRAMAASAYSVRPSAMSSRPQRASSTSNRAMQSRTESKRSSRDTRLGVGMVRSPVAVSSADCGRTPLIASTVGEARFSGDDHRRWDRRPPPIGPARSCGPACTNVGTPKGSRPRVLAGLGQSTRPGADCGDRQIPGSSPFDDLASDATARRSPERGCAEVGSHR